MTQVTLQPRKEQSKQPSAKIAHDVRLNVIQSKGVRGICGHIARSANDYCGSPRCAPWGY